MMAIMNLIKYAVLLGVVPYLNFVYWREYGGQVAHRERLDRCPSRPITSIDARMHRGAVHEGYEAENGPRAAKKPCRPLAPPAASSHASSHCTSPVISNQDYGKVSKVDSKLFGEYKGEHLIQLKSPALTTTVLDPHGQGGRGPPNPVKALQGVHAECRTIVNPLASAKKPCIAVVQADIPNAFNRLRIGLRDEKTGATVRHPWFNHTAAPQPTGFFGMGHMGGSLGRDSLRAKLGPLLLNLEELESLVRERLRARGIEKGSDVVLVVLNDGEIDIFLNFACSCRAHGLEAALRKVVVFAGSKELVTLVEAAGATAIYHSSFFIVNRGASYQYLDKTFTDMMWYKSFSLWVMLKLGYHVLFQDADLVWFKDPFPYFHRVLREEGRLVTFFSDDGQRSMRYTPFYANSGFYYLPSEPHTIAFAYQIVISFDSLYTMGSHQNIFTTKLQEMMDVGGVTSRMLSLDLFPTGVQYHHNKKFMQRFLANNGSEAPYGFHMCWTSNKREKIKFFKETGMWYVQERCYISHMTPAAASNPKSMYNSIVKGHAKMQGAGDTDEKPALDQCCIKSGSKKFKVFKS